MSDPRNIKKKLSSGSLNSSISTTFKLDEAELLQNLWNGYLQSLYPTVGYIILNKLVNKNVKFAQTIGMLEEKCEDSNNSANRNTCKQKFNKIKTSCEV